MNETLSELVNATTHIEEASGDGVLLMRHYARQLLLPIFCLIGIIGNFMALLLIRTNFWLKRLTSNVYLCTLSVCGCIFLSTVVVTWADAIYGVPLYSNNEVGCKIFTFAAHFCDFICVWMISWVSIDRMIVLYRPGIRKYVCTKRFARNLVIGTVLLSSLLYSWLFAFAGLETYEKDFTLYYCGLDSDAKIFGHRASDLYVVFTMLDTALCTVIPSILIMVVNIFSIHRYRQCMRIYAAGVLRVRFLRSSNGGNGDDELPYEETTAKKLLLSQSHDANTQLSTQSTRSAPCGKLRSSDLQLSRSLLIVTSTFVLLNVPNYIIRLVDWVLAPQSDVYHLVFYATYLLYYLHHAVLFYMYIFWSPQMKKQLAPTAMRLLECYCFKTVPEFGHRSTSMQQFNRN